MTRQAGVAATRAQLPAATLTPIGWLKEPVAPRPPVLTPHRHHKQQLQILIHVPRHDRCCR